MNNRRWSAAEPPVIHDVAASAAKIISRLNSYKNYLFAPLVPSRPYRP
jgi:hypothetical protein